LVTAFPGGGAVFALLGASLAAAVRNPFQHQGVDFVFIDQDDFRPESEAADFAVRNPSPQRFDADGVFLGVRFKPYEVLGHGELSM
jgi:hypothetical protein